MNRLKRVGDRFKFVMRKIDGTEFMGQILDIPDTSRVTNFLSARRYLRTNVDTIVQARDVIIAGGTTYIVAEHGTGFYKEPIYKHFKLFEVDSAEMWYPLREYEHPITGLKESRRDKPEGLVYLSTQPTNNVQDSINIPNEMKIMICNANIQLGDKVGNYLATKSDLEIGINLLTMKEL